MHTNYDITSRYYECTNVCSSDLMSLKGKANCIENNNINDSLI